MMTINSISKLNPLIEGGFSLTELPEDHRLYPFARDAENGLIRHNWDIELHPELRAHRNDPEEACYFSDRLYLDPKLGKIIFYTGDADCRLSPEGNRDNLFCIAFALRCIPHMPIGDENRHYRTLLMEADAASHAMATATPGAYKTYSDAAYDIPNFLCATRDVMGERTGEAPGKSPEQFLCELRQHDFVEEILRETQKLKVDDPAMDHLARFLAAEQGSRFHSGYSFFTAMSEVNTHTRRTGFHEYIWQLRARAQDVGGAMAAETELRLFREIKNLAGMPNFPPRPMRPVTHSAVTFTPAKAEKGVLLAFAPIDRSKQSAPVAAAPK